MPEAHKAINPVFEYQTPATLVQVAPVQNTWYDILETTTNIRLYGVSVEVLTTGETLEVRLIIDGVTYTASVAAVAGTDYHLYMNWDPTVTVTGLSTNPCLVVAIGGPSGNYRGIFLDGRSVRVSVRKTTANGAGTINGLVQYERIPDA